MSTSDQATTVSHSGGAGRRGSSSRDLVLIAIFAAITAALGLLPKIPVPWSPVPITAQSLGVMLAGAVLGARKGFLSQLLFIVLVAIGLPLLAGSRGGLGYFVSASGGFLVGYVVCAGAVGWLSERFGHPYTFVKGLVANLVGGLLLMDVFGVLGFMAFAHMKLVPAIAACAPFLLGDTIKAVIAALVAAGVHRAYPGLLRGRRAA